MKNMKVYVRIIGIAAIALLLGACILQPSSEKTGSVEIYIAAGSASASSVGASNVDEVPTHARIWLYQNGEDFRQTMLNLGSNRRVKFEGIPEGSDYTLVAILGTNTGDPEIFLPSAFARSEPFQVSAGRETVVSPVRRDIAGEGGLVAELQYPAALIGKSVGSVVQVDNEWFAAVPGEQRVYRSLGEGDGILMPSRLFSVSAGTVDSGNAQTLLVNTEDGILAPDRLGPRDWTNASLLPSAPADVRNVVDSGAFFTAADGVTADATVVYYSRWGGLGGVSVANFATGTFATEDWGDSGEDLEDMVDTEESPIRAMATDGTNAAYIASVLGTFKMTKEFIDGDDIDIGALLGGNDDEAKGFTFFGVAYPGSSRPMRIERIGLIPGSPNRVIVGTGRGAFWFNGNVVDESLTASGLVPAGSLSQIQIPGVQDRAVIDIAVGQTRVAIATRERLTVMNQSDLQTPILQLPMRAVALGRPQNVFLDPSGWLYVAAEEGLTAIKLK